MITTPYTFIATSTCVMNNLGVPVYTDIDPNTYNMDANQIERLIPFPATADRVPPELLSPLLPLQDCHLGKQSTGKPSGKRFSAPPQDDRHRPPPRLTPALPSACHCPSARDRGGTAPLSRPTPPDRDSSRRQPRSSSRSISRVDDAGDHGHDSHTLGQFCRQRPSQPLDGPFCSTVRSDLRSAFPSPPRAEVDNHAPPPLYHRRQEVPDDHWHKKRRYVSGSNWRSDGTCY